MAKRRPPEPAASGVPSQRYGGYMFARSPQVWRSLGAPECMFDDEAAVACYDEWMPGQGDAKLRAALIMRVVPLPDVSALKVDYLRRVAAPRLLWRSDALDPGECAALTRRTRVLHAVTPTNRAPGWLTEPEPWRTGP